MPSRRRIPIAVPWPVRKRLYSWHPGRARRWRELPGLQRVGDGVGSADNGVDVGPGAGNGDGVGFARNGVGVGPGAGNGVGGTGVGDGVTHRAVLTFDDGPGPDATPRVLDELERLDVRATFFVLGAEVRREPELARRILAGGHELGLHGFAHPRYDLISPEQARTDLEQGLEAIESATGVRPTWFRPPYGKLSETSHQVCRSLDLDVVYWSAWGLDWEAIGAEAIAAEVTRALTPGTIVLLHDTARYGRRSSAAPTAEALRAIVARGREMGLRWTTLAGTGDRVAGDTGTTDALV